MEGIMSYRAMFLCLTLTAGALLMAWKRSSNGGLEVKVHPVPEKIEKQVASLKLASMGIRIDRLTGEQKHYLSSWDMGTS